MHDTPLMDRVIRRVSLLMPNLFAANAALLGLHFLMKNRRLPRTPVQEQASLSDYVFWKSIGYWSDFERACVDKETAKHVARQLCPQIGIPELIDVFPVQGLSYQAFRRKLLAYGGRAAVAKPTHGSGAILFLDGELSERELRKFHRDCRASYFQLFREGQYYRLEKKVLIERRVSDRASRRGVADDYKFFCSRGHAFLCQINVDRFGDHRLINMTVPDFTDSGVEYGTHRPDTLPERPPRWNDFVRFAERLSQPFEFVRVDLYDGDDDIYFGEFTFTPGAGLTSFSEADFDRWLMVQVRQASDGPASWAAHPRKPRTVPRLLRRIVRKAS